MGILVCKGAGISFVFRQADAMGVMSGVGIATQMPYRGTIRPIKTRAFVEEEMA